jgi:hypothetical protein
MTAIRTTSTHQGVYAAMIREYLARAGREEIDSRHVEAYIRLEHGTLDHLSAARFEGEVLVAIRGIDEEGTAAAEALAGSYGL